jgi:hypothetical protein
MGPGALNIPHFLPVCRGTNTVVHWTAMGQTQPELASGIMTSPLAGMQLIQHPGR